MFDNGEESLIIHDVDITKIERSWSQRTFSKIEKDSIRNTMLVLLAASLGTGSYSMHHLLDETGIVWGIVILAIGFMCSVLSFDIYTHASKRVGSPESYPELFKKSAGQVFYFCTIFVNLIYLSLIIISYSVCICKLAYLVFYSRVWDYMSISEENRQFMVFTKYMSFVVGFMGFILIVPRSIDRLASLSSLSFLVNIYLLILVLFQTPSYYNLLIEKGENSFNFFSASFKSVCYQFGLVICSYNNIPNFLIIRNNVRNPSRRRLRKVYVRTDFIMFILFVINGLSSYASVGLPNTGSVDLIIFRPQLGLTDNLMIVGQILFLLAMIIAYSFIAFPLKTMILDLLGSKTDKANFITALIICLLGSWIASNFDNVSAYITLTGAFCGTCMSIVFPAIIALNTGYCKNSTFKIGIITWLVVGSIVGSFSTYYCLEKFISN